MSRRVIRPPANEIGDAMSKAVVRPLIIAGVVAAILLNALHLLNATQGKFNCAHWYYPAGCTTSEVGALILFIVILVLGVGLYIANERRP
jgi:hypothetical protein